MADEYNTPNTDYIVTNDVLGDYEMDHSIEKEKSSGGFWQRVKEFFSKVKDFFTPGFRIDKKLTVEQYDAHKKAEAAFEKGEQKYNEIIKAKEENSIILNDVSNDISKMLVAVSSLETRLDSIDVKNIDFKKGSKDRDELEYCISMNSKIKGDMERYRSTLDALDKVQDNLYISDKNKLIHAKNSFNILEEIRSNIEYSLNTEYKIPEDAVIEEDKGVDISLKSEFNLENGFINSEKCREYDIAELKKAVESSPELASMPVVVRSSEFGTPINGLCSLEVAVDSNAEFVSKDMYRMIEKEQNKRDAPFIAMVNRQIKTEQEKDTPDDLEI